MINAYCQNRRLVFLSALSIASCRVVVSRPARHRLIAFAVAFGLAISGSLQAQQESDPGDAAAADEQQQANTLPPEISVRIIEDGEAAEARQRREEEAQERQIEDLIAQQRMAEVTEAMNEATQRMASYAYWSTIIIAIGTALLVWTLMLTRHANISAREAVDETRKIGKAQLRAYVCNTSTDVDIVNNIEGEMAYVFSRVFTNLGQTPADDCRFAVSWNVEIDGEFPTGDGLGEGRSDEKAPGIRLGPSQSMSTKPMAFLRSEVERASRGECGLFLGARVDYTDHAGEKRFIETYTRVYVLKEGLDKEPFAKDELFRFAPYGKNNQAT